MSFCPIYNALSSCLACQDTANTDPGFLYLHVFFIRAPASEDVDGLVITITVHRVVGPSVTILFPDDNSSSAAG
jgi:hypothetical protein